MRTETRNRRGKSLQEIAGILQGIQNTAEDYTVPIERLQSNWDGKNFNLNVNGSSDFGLNTHSSGQVANYTDIPTKYFRKLHQENPELLAKNVNHAFERTVTQNDGKKRESRLLRTVEQDGQRIVRGFMSGRYKRLDNFDLVNVLYPMFQKHGLEVVEANLDEKKFYIKAVSNLLTTEVKAGDIVRWGLVVSNSDVGASALNLSKFLDRCFCDNGMTLKEGRGFYHVGRNSHEDQFSELLSERSLSLDEQATFSKLQDLLEASLNPDNFEIHVNRLREAAMLPIKSLEPVEVVKTVMKQTGIFGDAKEQSIVSALASGNEGAGLTKWGLINSFTRAAKNDAWSYEESQELEVAAGQILEMNKDQWEVLAS